MSGFFDTSGFPARWSCGDWSPTLGWLTIASDVAIFAAYTALPLTIAWYVRKRRDVPFPMLFWLFSTFIFACGATHLLEVVIFWYPIYPLQAVLKLFTALVSIATVVAVASLMPTALTLPGLAAVNQRLSQEIAAGLASQAELQRRSEELQRNEDRLLTAQREARIGDWSFDPLTQRIFWSEEIYRLFARPPAQGPPQDLDENLRLYTPAGAAALSALLTRLRAGEQRVEGTLEVRLPGGASGWHRTIMHAQRTWDGTVTRLWGTAQDITEQKLDELAKDRHREELLRINQQLEQFAYIASHDLVEPLRKMRFFTDILKEESRDRLNAEGEDALARLGIAGERMANLVRDLLAFTRAGKSPAALKPVDMDAVLQQACGNLVIMMRDADARILVDTLPDVIGDSALLVQVFQQLLTNALFFRHPERAPLIEVSAQSHAGMVHITVRDNGLGFSAEQTDRLFQPFVRLHPQVAHSGTGIGLAICRRILEVHGGRISAAPGVDAGAEFTVVLPKMKEPDHGH